MLTINGTMPHQILFNGVDLTQVYARATAADTPVLVWTKGAISITGNKFYLKDAIHNQIRIYQNGTLKDTIAAGFSGTQTLSFTLASGNTLLIQLYNPSSGWSQNIYNGTVSSSTWYYENFTETTVNKTIPAGTVHVDGINNNPGTGWMCNTTWPYINLDGSDSGWIYNGNAYEINHGVHDCSIPNIGTLDVPAGKWSWDSSTGGTFHDTPISWTNVATGPSADYYSYHFLSYTVTKSGNKFVCVSGVSNDERAYNNVSSNVTVNVSGTFTHYDLNEDGSITIRAGHVDAPTMQEVGDVFRQHSHIDHYVTLSKNTSGGVITFKTNTVKGTWTGDDLTLPSTSVTYYTYDYN